MPFRIERRTKTSYGANFVPTSPVTFEIPTFDTVPAPE
jgi:hypothetical protein